MATIELLDATIFLASKVGLNCCKIRANLGVHTWRQCPQIAGAGLREIDRILMGAVGVVKAGHEDNFAIAHADLIAGGQRHGPAQLGAVNERAVLGCDIVDFAAFARMHQNRTVAAGNKFTREHHVVVGQPADRG